MEILSKIKTKLKNIFVRVNYFESEIDFLNTAAQILENSSKKISDQQQDIEFYISEIKRLELVLVGKEATIRNDVEIIETLQTLIGQQSIKLKESGKENQILRANNIMRSLS